MAKTKRHRRYREKPGTIGIGLISNGRVHDFMKGWGTLCADGSILWDYWRPPTKRSIERLERHWKKHPPFSKWTFPIIKNMPTASLLGDLESVQPMQGPA